MEYQNNLFYKMIEVFPALIWKAGLDAKCDYFNKSWLEFTGRTLEQEMGDGWVEGIHENDLKECYNTYINAFNKREKFEMEYRLLHHSGEYKWILDFGTPMFDENSTFLGYIGACYDISELKNTNEYTLKLSHQLKEKNTELEKFAYIISHDIRTPLINIHGFTREIQDIFDKIKSEIDNSSNISELKNNIAELINTELPFCFEHIYISARKIDKLISSILKYSRLGRESVKYSDFDFKIFIHSIINNFKQQLKQIDAKIQVYGEGLCKGNEPLLNQAISNLIDNAIKYRSNERLLEINIFFENCNTENVIIVKDNGLGISEGNLKKIFDVFFKINLKLEGEGIGLSLVKKAIEIHQGNINVESKLDIGTQFIIKIPNNIK